MNVPLIQNIKNTRFVRSPFYSSFIFLDNTSYKFWDQHRCPIINVVCKYLRQFFGTGFGVATLPIGGSKGGGRGGRGFISIHLSKNRVELNNLCEILKFQYRTLSPSQVIKQIVFLTSCVAISSRSSSQSMIDEAKKWGEVNTKIWISREWKAF